MLSKMLFIDKKKNIALPVTVVNRKTAQHSKVTLVHPNYKSMAFAAPKSGIHLKAPKHAAKSFFSLKQLILQFFA